MYILLEFDEQSRKVVEAVPEKWVLSSNECFWPNGNSNFVQRMLKKQEIIPKEPFFRRVPYAAELGRFKSYLEARNMAKYYSDQETTVQSDEETFAQDVDPDYSNSETQFDFHNTTSAIGGTSATAANAVLEESPILLLHADELECPNIEIESGSTDHPKQKENDSMLERIVGIEICQKEILEKLNHLQNTLDHIRNIGQARPNTNEITDIIKSFPLKTQLSLNSLEDILSVNPIKRAALVAHLRLTGGTHLMNFIRNIMRSVFTDDCLSLFCWNGSDVKKSFQTLEIAKVIIESIETSKFLLVNRHDYIKVIRDFLDQARNRIKGRKRSDLLKQIEGRRSTV